MVASLRGFDVSDIGLTSGDSIPDLITLFTSSDENIGTISLPTGQFKIFNNFYSNIYIRSNGWLSLYGATEVNFGRDNQIPINTLRFFGQDHVSIIKYKYDTVGDLLLFCTGYNYYIPSQTFDISLKITKLGLIYVKYNNILILYSSNPIIGWVGSNSSISTDDIFYNGYNGSKALTKIDNNLSLELVGKTVLFCSAIDAKNALPDAVNTLGFTTEELSKINFTLADLKAVGFTATDLKAANFSATDLKAAGFSLTALKAANFSATDLKAAGFSLTALKAANFSATALKAANFSATDLKAAGFSLTALKAANFSATDLKAANFSATDLKAANFSATDLKAANFSVNDLKSAGFTASQISRASTYEMKHSGFSISQMTKAGYSAFQFKAIGINASILKNNGFTIYNLKDAGFTIAALKLVFTRDELSEVFTSAELL